MKTSWHGTAFRISSILCWKPPTKGTVIQNCDDFFVVGINKRFNKQWNWRSLSNPNSVFNHSMILNLYTCSVASSCVPCLSYLYWLHYGTLNAVLKITTNCHPKTCKNCLSRVNKCVDYARKIRKITRYCLTQWISKLSGSLEIHWVRQYLVIVVLFGIRDQ